MANRNISNISYLNGAFSSLKRMTDGKIKSIKDQYSKTLYENTYYREPKVLKLIIFLVISVALFYLSTIKRADIAHMEQLQFTSKYFKTSMFEKILLYVGFILAFWALYKAIVEAYCIRLKGFSRRIDKIEKELNARVDGFKTTSLERDILAAAEQNKEYDFPMKNDMGEKISAVLSDLKKTNKRAYTVRKIVRFAVTIIFFAVLYLFDFRYFKQEGAESYRFAAFLLILATTVLVHTFEFNLGEYLGKLSKPLGLVAAAVSCFLIMLGLKNVLPGDFYDVGKEIPVVNKAYLVVPVVAFIGILVSVICSHYSLEKERWEKGFSVAMSYGSKDNGNKGTLLFRGGLSLLLAAMAIICSVSMTGESAAVVGILWYCANPLLKPRGSYIYTFFGRGKCIGNEIIMLALCLYLQLEAVGTLNSDFIVFVICAAITHFAVALGCKIVNEIIF